MDTIRLDLPATALYLNVLSDSIAAMLAHTPNIAEATLYNIQLAVQEASTNIIDHAYAGAPGRIGVALTLSSQPRHLIVELHDTGKSFDLSSIPPANLDEPHVRGYGLFLIQQLMDEVKYMPTPGGNIWRLVKAL